MEKEHTVELTSIQLADSPIAIVPNKQQSKTYFQKLFKLTNPNPEPELSVIFEEENDLSLLFEPTLMLKLPDSGGQPVERNFYLTRFRL